MNGPCEYCNKSSPIRIQNGENGSHKDVFVCDVHWELLQNPKTAIPLIRGVITSKIRGTGPPSYLKRKIDDFMEKMSKLKPNS